MQSDLNNNGDDDDDDDDDDGDSDGDGDDDDDDDDDDHKNTLKHSCYCRHASTFQNNDEEINAQILRVF